MTPRIRVALQYVLATTPDAAVLVGFRSPHQIEMNIDAHGEPSTTSEIADINEAMSQARDTMSHSPPATGKGVNRV